MYYFDRLCKIVIENNNKIEISDCKIKFEVMKSSVAKENTAKIDIYNLSPTTRSMIARLDTLVRIYAGYANYKGLVEIGQGDISKVKTNRDLTEVVTEIYLTEGLKRIRTNPVTLSYKKDPKLSDILDSVKSQTGFGIRTIGVDTSSILSGGYSDIGSVDNVLDNLAIQFDFDWSVQNGVVLIKGRKITSQKEIMLLTPQSGLILNPEAVHKVSRKIEKSKITKEFPRTHSITALLQPQLQVQDVIAIESQDLNGKFKIEKLTHKGDTYGNDWYSDMEVVAL